MHTEHNTIDARVVDQIEKMVSRTEHVNYRGISIGQALKVSFHNYVRTRLAYEGSTVRFKVYTLKRVMIILIRIACGLMWGLAFRRLSKSLRLCHNAKILVICDHAGHIEQTTIGLIEGFQNEDVILCTSSRRVFNRLKEQCIQSINLYGVLQYCRWKSLPNYYHHYLEVFRALDEKHFLLKIETFGMVCSVLQAIDYYNTMFDTIKVLAVMTMSDRHWNEYVLTMSAQQRGILTYSNQHGEFTDLTDMIPISSDRIFVWGEKTKEHLIKHSVQTERVVVSGNPKFDRVHSWYLPRKDMIKKRMYKEYGLTDGLPVVTYLSPGIFSMPYLSQDVAFYLFNCFSQIHELPVNTIVKLHPYQDRKKIFRHWFSELKMPNKTPLLQTEDLFDILAITDIAVTFQSTTGLEAIGFGIPTIVLNLIDGVDVRKYVTYVDDAIECRTFGGYRNVMHELVTNQEKYMEEIKRVSAVRERYFRNSETFNTSEFVRDFIISNVKTV